MSSGITVITYRDNGVDDESKVEESVRIQFRVPDFFENAVTLASIEDF
jgi:hypothetical protein